MKNLFPFCLLLLSLQLPFGSPACGNEYQTQTRPDGQATRLNENEGGTSPAQFRHGFDTSSLVRQREILQLRLEKDSSYQDVSDLALIELKIGDKYLGVQLLEKLYQQHPNEYPIVANLGTGYELTDNTELAYRFIKQALEINPEAHRGSEWIHLNILEQKLSPSPDYSNILKLGTGKSITAHFQSLNESQIQDLFPIKEQLIYQLEERIAFIAPEDAVIGQLLFDLADLVALTESVERSEAFYHFAHTYDPGLTLVESRLQEIEEIRYVNPFDGVWHWLLIGIMLLVAGFYLLSWLIRKRGSSARPTKAA